MPLRSSIERLPPEVREWLEAELLRRGFADYVPLTADLNAKLDELGYEVVSKSAVHKYGQKFEESVRRIKVSTETARALAKEVGDDDGALNDAVLRTVQSQMFNVLTDLEIDPQNIDVKKLVKLGHLAADLGRASVSQKKLMAAIREKAAAAAESVASEARKAGLSETTVDDIKRQILGIADAR